MAGKRTSAPGQQDLPVDPADSMFEPTGDLFKDCCAYCEIEDKEERGDVLDCIGLEDMKGNPRAAHTPESVHTTLFVRGLEAPLHKRDMSPLSNAIPHCNNLYEAKFFGCRLSVDSWKLLVEAVYKSASVSTLQVDFNAELSKRDPTATRREAKAEHFLYPAQARGGLARQQQTSVEKGGKPGGKEAKKPPPKGKVEEEPPSMTPIKTPDGWEAALLTHVKELTLRGNGIDDSQCVVLAKGLESNTELLSINLWGNAISNTGARALAAALRVNQRLTSLNLADNKIEDAGVSALADILRQTDVKDGDAPDGFKALRSKVRAYMAATNEGSLPEEVPLYPTFAELTGEPAGGAVKKPPPKGKPAKGAPAGKAEEPWDRDCVRVSETTMRIPGNRALWSINLSNNRKVSATAVERFITILEGAIPPDPPTPVDGLVSPAPSPGGKRKSILSTEEVPPPPCNAIGCKLARLVIDSPGMSREPLERLAETLGRLAVHQEKAKAISQAP